MNKTSKAVWVCSLMVLAGACLVSAEDWTQWRGPKRDGKSAETGLLKQWPASGPTLLWKTTGLGIGYSGITMSGKCIYTTGDQGDANYAIALDRATGKKIWSVKLGKSGAPGWGGFAGPRSSVTIDGDRLYVVGQYGEFVCLNAADGKEIWRKHLVQDFGGKVPEWGYSESPLIDGDQVMLTPGGSRGSVVALNKLTGATIWQSKGITDEAHYSSLVLSDFGGTRHYVQLTAEHVFGVSAKDGAVLWKAVRKGRTAVIPTPIVQGDLVFVTSGYSVGCNAFKITKGASGYAAEQVYASKEFDNHHGGAILHEGHVYGHADSRGWICMEQATGRIVWREREAAKKGSLVFADGHFILREEDKSSPGRLILIAATPAGYQEKGRFDQPDRSDKNSWTHPVVSDGRLYVRDQDLLLCYDVKAK
ncbi:MAG TPA: PQQ-like beta-propeller repeat protein [Candidatus Paceibacterota bacterium]|nr:PQQ-like beta-propeller repeat protein [Candidatus Paceibacterota bacterium]